MTSAQAAQPVRASAAAVVPASWHNTGQSFFFYVDCEATATALEMRNLGIYRCWGGGTFSYWQL
ncbi:hypothetical protein, partial [Streptomyces hirsutus]|uniref:hypothetical protein n=1 Tax=Streptomyces hirsutus TaxID=35620 RepID=UPI001B80D4D5